MYARRLISVWTSSYLHTVFKALSTLSVSSFMWVQDSHWEYRANQKVELNFGEQGERVQASIATTDYTDYTYDSVQVTFLKTPEHTWNGFL